MEKYSAIEKGWITILVNPDPEKVLSVLYEIRNSGSVNLFPVLFKMISKNSDSRIRTEILKLVSEIKSQEAIPLIAESLEHHDFGDHLPAFVAACWQSGLDFSKHLRVFAGVFIQADYMSALEAFTVIEESIPNATDDDISGCLRFLRDAECMVTDEKMPLFLELRKVIESS
jgi:hypothetical protein